MKQPLVQIKNAAKSYSTGKIEVPALRGVTADIYEGEFTSIAGSSGSGKTTLLNLIGCLDAATSGSIIIDGTDITALNARGRNEIRRSKIGFIFQNYNLIPVLTAQENVELALNLQKNLTRTDIKLLASDILAEVGLDGLQNRKPNELSGGQQQRVSIARALVKKPQLILADEPTANLDSRTGIQILELMQNLNQKHNTTFIFSTHDDKVMSYTRRILHLEDGKIASDSAANTSAPTTKNAVQEAVECSL